MSHPFGDLISIYLSRKHGLSQNKLALDIGQKPSVISDMCHGRRLSGSKARDRVVAIIRWLREQEALTLVEEANALLEAAGMAALNPDQKQEALVLQSLQTQINAAQSEKAGPPNVAPVHQIPDPPRDFVGRDTELADLMKAIEEGAAIIGLFGMSGVGKTALALKLAEALLSRYPDAQFYLNLKGTTQQPLTAAEAMAHVIRGYHPREKLPESEPELQGLYRSVLHGQRALLLMDNAANAAQVAPLTPPANCVLIITSRDKFTLPGILGKNIDVLPPHDAHTLLLVIAPRIADQVESIALLCGYLPLALRAAASSLAEASDLGPTIYAAQLKNERTRLERIGKGEDVSVAASFNQSYLLLPPDTARVFVHAAVFPGSFDASAEEVVCEDDRHIHLSNLVRRNLVMYDIVTKRYRLHDLTRLFADDHLDEQERNATHKRHAIYFGTLLHTAAKFYEQGDQLMGLALFDWEHENIEAGLRWAAFQSDEDLEAAALCSRYVQTGRHFLDLRQYPDERLRWLEFALKAARQLKWREDEATHLANMGIAYSLQGNAPRALEYLEQALSIFSAIGNSAGEGRTLADIGIVYRNQGKHRDSIEYFKRHLDIARIRHDRRGESEALGNLGVAHKNLGEFNSAIDCYRQSLAICREIGEYRGEGATLSDLGAVYFETGDVLTAIECYGQARTIARRIGDQRNEGIVLTNLGSAYLKIGQAQQAIECQEQALVITRESSDRLGEGITLSNLGEAYTELSDIEHALALYNEALNIAREIADPEGKGTALWNISLAFDKQAKRAQALEYARQALPIFEQIEHPKAGEVRKQIAQWEQELAK